MTRGQHVGKKKETKQAREKKQPNNNWTGRLVGVWKDRDKGYKGGGMAIDSLLLGGQQKVKSHAKKPGDDQVSW